jgi:hypothetical protein
MKAALRMLRARWMSASVLLVLSVAAAHASITLDVHTGFENSYRLNAWTPLTVRLSGTGRASKASLQLVVKSSEFRHVYAQPLRLPDGPVNEQRVFYYQHNTSGGIPEISVQLIVNGRVTVEKKVEGAIPLDETQLIFLSLSQDQSGLNFLNSTDLGFRHPSPPPINLFSSGPALNPTAGGSSSAVQKLTRVLYPRANLLPDAPAGYDAVDVILIGDLPLDTLTEDQWDAIVQWTRQGGLLVISGGSDINRYRSNALKELLPIVPTEVRQARDLPALRMRYGINAPRVNSLPLVIGALKPDGTLICVHENLPLISLRREGLGSVIFTAFDVAAPELRAWSGQTSMWRDFLSQGQGQPRILDRVRLSLSSIGRTNRYNRYRDDYSGANLLLDALAGVQSTKAPDFLFIGGFLLAYILCLVPVNYFLLRMRDRKELAWITAPIVILLFSAGAYAIGYSMKGGQLHLNHCTIIEGAANENFFSAYAVSSIFSPRQAAYSLSLADRSALVTEVSTRLDRIHQASSDYIIERDGNTTVRNARINMWDTRTFDFLSSVRLNGGISSSVSPVDSKTVRVSVSNNTPYTLEDCSVSIRGEMKPLGSMAPGETRSENISAFQAGGSAQLVIPTGSSNREEAARIQQAMASLIGSQSGYQPAVNTTPTPQPDNTLYFTGWFYDPVMELKIEKESPQTFAVNLLVVHLPHARHARAPLPMNTPPPSSAKLSPFNAPPPGVASANYYNQMAYNYANSGQLDLALDAAKRAHQLAPGDGNILDTLGEMYQRKGDFSQAERYLRLALRHQRGAGLTETHAKYGEVLAALGRKEEAVSHLEKAAADTSAPIWAERAQKALEKLGHSP